jgi:hypothetical protein
MFGITPRAKRRAGQFPLDRREPLVDEPDGRIRQGEMPES